MSTISCTYRIYPSWFGGDDVARPMKELADSSAATIGRRVQAIEVIGTGTDHCGGHFMEFLVTYSSTAQQLVEKPWEERQ